MTPTVRSTQTISV